MWNPGKLIIIAILAVGMGAGIFAWRHQYRRGAQVMELWGTDNTYRIRMAPKCDLLQLKKASVDALETLEVDGSDWEVVQRTDISSARGWVHARQALIQDVSYRWDQSKTESQWTTAIVFHDPAQPNQTTVLAIDLNSGDICDVQTRRRGNVSPIVDGLRRFFDEQWNEMDAD